MKIKFLKSPVDTRDYKASSYVNSLPQYPDSYLAALTRVRCQWFSSQCVAFSCTQAMSQQEALSGKYNVYSTGYLYANREESDLQEDGWYVRQCLKNLQKYGTVLHEEFPHNHDYEEEKKHIEENKAALAILADKHRISTYFKCSTIDEIKATIIKYGAVITSCDIHGKDWFLKSKIDADQISKPLVCGHAFILVGWDGNYWIAQDSYSIFRPCFGRFKLSMDYPMDEFWGIIL